MALSFWQPNTLYSAGNRVLDSNGSIQQFVAYGSPPTTTGTSGANPPIWSQILDAITIDNTIHWELMGYRTVQLAVKPLGPAVQTPLNAISVSQGNIDAGAIPLLRADGTIDPSMVTGSGGGGNATEIQNIPVAPTPPSHNGELLIYDSMTNTYIPGDPLVQGVIAVGTAVAGINPVLIGGSDLSGNLQNTVMILAGSPPILCLAVHDPASSGGSGGSVTQGTVPWVVSGTVTANQGTSPWTVGGTVAVTQSTSPWVVSLASTTITGTVAVTQSTSPWVTSDNHFTHNLNQDGSGNVGVNIENFPATTAVTQSTSPWVVSGTVTSNIQASGTPLTATGSSLNVNITGGASSGTQYADNAASGATPTGTLSMGWDSTALKVRALKVDNLQNLQVNLAEISTTVEGSPAETALDVHITNVSAVPVADSTASSTSSVPSQTAISNTSSTILAANPLRKESIIVNTGTTVVFLALGQTPTSTAYHVALSACSTANDGTGGTFTDSLWTGVINAICTVSGTVCVTELT